MLHQLKNATKPVSGQLHPRKIARRLALGFRLVLGLGGGGNFPRGQLSNNQPNQLKKNRFIFLFYEHLKKTKKKTLNVSKINTATIFFTIGRKKIVGNYDSNCQKCQSCVSLLP